MPANTLSWNAGLKHWGAMMIEELNIRGKRARMQTASEARASDNPQTRVTAILTQDILSICGAVPDQGPLGVSKTSIALSALVSAIGHIAGKAGEPAQMGALLMQLADGIRTVASKTQEQQDSDG